MENAELYRRAWELDSGSESSNATDKELPPTTSFEGQRNDSLKWLKLWRCPWHLHSRCSVREETLQTRSPTLSVVPLRPLQSLSIQCVRVGGVEIPNNKRVEFSLQYIHGIGRTRSRQILYDLNLENKITKDLSEEELKSVRDEVSKFMIEGELRRFNALNIRRLIDIQCYRGVRHQKGLPCRGQRTKNNCRTLKGKRVSIAGKKKAPR